MYQLRQSQPRKGRTTTNSKFLRLVGELVIAVSAFGLGSHWVRSHLRSCNHHETFFQKMDPEVRSHPVGMWGIPVQPHAIFETISSKEQNSSISLHTPCHKPLTIFLNSLDSATCLVIVPDITNMNDANTDFLVSFTQSNHPKQVSEFRLSPWYEDHNRRPPWRLASAPKPVLLQGTWWSSLSDYSFAYNDAREALRNLLKPAKRKSWILLVASSHHLELLENLNCAARRLHIDRSHILVMALDDQVLRFAQNDLGLLTFFHKSLAESLSVSSNAEYASQTYGAIMLVAKVHMVHLFSELGEYDFLFQDVDVLPLRREYFDRMKDIAESQMVDMVFQYDYFYERKTPPEYAPWFVNSGLFYVKNNPRTRNFFASLVQYGDLVLRSKSHQAMVSWLLSQHVSRYGLRVHVMNENEEADEFPGGYHFHNRWDYMRDMLVSRSIKPLAFHMNYNDKKATKRAFFEQMGLWFTEDHSCAEKPIPRCHYSDKPSALDCRNSPAIESGDVFWRDT